MIMTPKILVGAAVAVMVAIIVGILATGPAMVADVRIPDSSVITGDTSASTQAAIIPLTVSLGDIEVKKITENSATLEVSFVLYNPNERSMIVQTLDYRLFETAHYDEGDTHAIAGGQIGSRPEGMVEFGSNYYTLLSGGTITLRDKVVIQNPGEKDLWDAIKADTASWRVAGDVFYNLSSMTSGQENVLDFEFTH